MQSSLQIAHQLLQPFASASRGREVIGNHSRMAEIQQKRRLLGGEAQEVLVVVVDNFHQVCKQHRSFVGRNLDPRMGKADIRDRRGLFWPPWRCCGNPFSGRGMEPGGDFHHNQSKQGHGNQQGAWMGHVTPAREA